MSVFDRVLVTGGGGMLASAFRRILPEARFAPKTELDIATTPADVDDWIEIVHPRPTLVINCAAYTKVDACETNRQLADSVNWHAVGWLAQRCKRIGARLVHFSTDYVFPGVGTMKTPWRVNDRIQPVNAYGQSKLGGERSLQEVNPPGWLLIRTAWLYGPNGPNFVHTILNAAKAGKQLTVVEDQIGSPTFTYDLAQITLELIEHEAAGIYHATNSGQTSWYGFAQAILEEFGLQAELRPISSEDWMKMRPDSARRPRYSVLDLDPLEKLLGRQPRHWRDALRDYAKMVR